MLQHMLKITTAPRWNDLIKSLIQLGDQRRCNLLSHRKSYHMGLHKAIHTSH